MNHTLRAPVIYCQLKSTKLTHPSGLPASLGYIFEAKKNSLHQYSLWYFCNHAVVLESEKSRRVLPNGMVFSITHKYQSNAELRYLIQSLHDVLLLYFTIYFVLPLRTPIGPTVYIEPTKELIPKW